MKYFSLASGSAGNSTAIVNDNGEILLIDCGISVNEIKKRLQQVGLNFNDIKKVLITHMHIDHCKSIRAFNSDDVYVNCVNDMPEFNQFDYYERFNLLGFDIYTLPMSHDSPGTSGFIITYNNKKMAYITDTGYIHENIQRLINNCDIYCIESNHDPRMLMLTNRPMYLKNRILSVNGHMSNQDCSYVLGNVIGPKTRQILFLHRSLEANSEDMIYHTFKQTMNKMNVNYSNIEVAIARQSEVVALPTLIKN